MNPKKVFHNTACSVQLPYIAGHSLKGYHCILPSLHGGSLEITLPVPLNLQLYLNETIKEFDLFYDSNILYNSVIVMMYLYQNIIKILKTVVPKLVNIQIIIR